MRGILGILLSLFLIAMPLFSEDEAFRKRGDSAQKATNQAQNPTNQTPNTTNRNGESSEDSAYQKRRETTRKRINTQKADSTKSDSAKVDSPKADSAKATNQATKKPQRTIDSKADSPKSASDSPKMDSQNAQTPTKRAKTQTNSAEIKKLTDRKKQLGYRNITIQNIKKQKKIGVDFFIGLQFGIDIVSMQHITEDDNRNKATQNSLSGSGSVGLKGGIVSEDEWVGGRFYAELSYTKYPKFDIVSVGVDLDLLVKYYEAVSWKIGGFIGLGGGMNLALIADKTLDSSGKKSLISVGWVNVGLVRFIYYHSTGNHGAELNAKIAYVTPTIYSLKDKATNITTSYKGSSSVIMLSYVYQF